MKKVGIVTIESENWGNRLQNYALQKVIEECGMDVETIDRHHCKKLMDKIKNNGKIVAKYILGIKGKKFHKFDKLINKSRHYVGKDDAEENIEKYFDYFIAGSDLLWNPHFPFVGKCDLLTFANKEQKVAYAASFGVENIPENKVEEYSKALKDFSAISMREEAGIKLVNKLSGVDAELVLDPTLLIKSDEWRKISKKPFKAPKGKYCLIYSLGERSWAFNNRIQEIKKKNELELFDIRRKNILGFDRCIGPAEFLYLVDNAEIILTDSFHAVVFSILFHKNVENYKRQGLNMNSRIETLSKIIGMDDYIGENELVLDKNTDYGKIDGLLENERKKSIDFLKKSLHCK